MWPLYSGTVYSIMQCSYVIDVAVHVPWAPDIEVRQPLLIKPPPNIVVSQLPQFKPLPYKLHCCLTQWESWTPPSWVAECRQAPVTGSCAVPPDILSKSHVNHMTFHARGPLFLFPCSFTVICRYTWISTASIEQANYTFCSHKALSPFNPLFCIIILMMKFKETLVQNTPCDNYFAETIILDIGDTARYMENTTISDIRYEHKQISSEKKMSQVTTPNLDVKAQSNKPAKIQLSRS